MCDKLNLMKNSAAFYDLDTRDIVRSDIPFYLDYAARCRGDILELACGTGRVTIELAKQGHNVYGLDLSEDMLQQCMHKYDRLPQEVKAKLNIQKRDMCDFDLGRRFSLIIIPFRGFQALVSEEEQRECLKCVRRHLDDNGLFILDVFKPNKSLDETWIYPKTKQWEALDEATGSHVVKNHTGVCIDTKKQLIDVEFEYCVTGKDGSIRNITDILKLKYYYYGQIRELLLSEGLEISEEYGYYDKSPVDNGPEMILVCRKKGK